MTEYYPRVFFYMDIVIMRKACLPPSSLNCPLHRFPSNLYKVKRLFPWNFTRLSITRRKTNLPVEQRLHWVSQKTTEGAGRRIKRTSQIDETVHGWPNHGNRKISGWTWQTLPKTVFCKVIAVLETISFFYAILNVCYSWLSLSNTSLQCGRAN